MSLVRRLAACTKPLVAASLAAAALLVSTQPVAAECNPPGADTSFRKAAPYAARIVVGRVVAVGPEATIGGDTGSYQFTLDVEHVLRGEAASTIEIDHLATGGCVRWLAAALGDHIVLALEVRRPDATYARNTSAWLSRTQAIANYEILSMAEIREVAREQLPETSTDADDADRGRPSAPSVPVEVEPRVAQPDQVVHVTGLVCVTPGGFAARPVSPDAFRLVDTDADPPWNTAHLTEPGDWYAFGPVETAADGSLSGDITVPNRRAGEYVFWWRCTGTGWRVSTGRTLVIKEVPDTDAVAAPIPPISDRLESVRDRYLAALLAASALAAALVFRSRSRHGRLR